jgi:NAD(P)-dependent dehydrogenase (short-subunit alcohol dehydrogenase family)
MRRSGGGRIIAIGSLAATEPRAGIGAYVVSKTALTTLFRTIALENADAGITSNVVMPATMDTPANRTDMPNADASKWVKPEDVAKLVMYLADERADKITGAVIPVYGPRP